MLTACSYLELVSKYPRARWRRTVRQPRVRRAVAHVHGCLRRDVLRPDLRILGRPGVRQHLPAGAGRGAGLAGRRRIDAPARAITGTLYLVIAVVSSLLVPTDVLASAGSGALMEVIQVGAPGFPLAVFAVVGLFAVSNSALINMLMASRLLYGTSREGIVPAALAAVHPTRRTPWLSILLTRDRGRPGIQPGRRSTRRHDLPAAAHGLRYRQRRLPGPAP